MAFKRIILLCCLATPHSLHAQADIVKGRITADSGRAVHAADVYITRAPDRETKLTRTDSLGHFSIRFEQGTGDYLINVRAIGYKPFRKRFSRAGNDTVIVADMVMQPEAIAVAAVVATATRQKPERDGTRFGTQQGSNERMSGEGVNGALSPAQAGDVAAVAANIPGMTATPSGVSALGLPADQNSVQLNGMNFGGGTVPRDARTTTRVSTSSFDPARGGYAGAQINLDLSPGNIFSGKRAHITADAPMLQFGDQLARAVGEEYRGLSTSMAVDGEITRDKWFYNLSFQSKNRSADYNSLITADNSLLTLAGVAPDSASRLLTTLQTVGVPGFGGVPTARKNDEYTLLARIDRTPYENHSFALTGYLDIARSGALGISPTVTPSFGGSTTDVISTGQANYSFYFGKNYLSDTRSALTYKHTGGDPYLRAPTGRVLLSSASLGFGGNALLETENSSLSWQTTSDWQFYTKANRHKLRVRGESLLERYNQASPADLFGTYTYQSINDLAANRPSSFSRTLQAPAVDGGMWSGVLAIGDNLRKSDKLNILYGARFEANHFLDRPDANPALQTAFGVRTDEAPNRVHVSPRFGFSWRRDPRNGRNGMSVNNIMTRYLVPMGVLRGGIGEFRSQMSGRLLSDAMRATGLPGGLLQLQCVGAAVPLPTWSSYLDNPAMIPEQCANGSPAVFADAARSVQVFAKDYDVARSWRANLGWIMTVKKVQVSLDGTYSLNVDQPGSYDLNFNGTPRLQLSGEGNRPVYVPATSIVATTGALSSAASRTSAAFGRVTERRSDLESRSAQFVTTITPQFSNWRFYGSLSYALSSSRAQFRGFDGGAFGDPSIVEWAPGNLDSRHQVTIQLGRIFKPFDVSLQHRISTGFPFTPLVEGDVNGDGIGFDRAFISAPINVGPGYAQSCVNEQVGKAADRNSCRGPLTNSLNVRFSPSKKFINTGSRISFALNMSKTWSGVPDPVLYRVRGFDAANQRFVYQVNERFGDTRSSRAIVRNPFRITLDVSLDLGRKQNIQQLERYLKPGRTQPGNKISADSMFGRYRRNVIDVYEEVMQESDSLLLSKEQIAQMKEMQKPYQAKVDSLWHDLTNYLANLPKEFNSAEALKRQEDAIDAAWEMARLEGANVVKILSPLQLQLLGGTVKYVITSKEKLQIRMFRN